MVLRPGSQRRTHPCRRPFGRSAGYVFSRKKPGKTLNARLRRATNRQHAAQLRIPPPVRLLTHGAACARSHMFDVWQLTSGRLDGSYAAKNATVSVAKRSVGAPVGANWPISTAGSAIKRCYKFNKDELGGCLKRQTPCIIRPVVHFWR